MIKVFDPYNKGLVPKKEFEYSLHAFFKGQFEYKGDDQGMSADIKRDLEEKGLISEQGQLITSKFRAALIDGTVDLLIFKQAVQ